MNLVIIKFPLDLYSDPFHLVKECLGVGCEP